MGVAEVNQAYLIEAGERTVPVGYKQTEVGVIPEDWEVKNLESLLKFVVEKAHLDFSFIQQVLLTLKLNSLIMELSTLK